MRREISEPAHRNPLFSPQRIRLREEAAAEALRPCTRFRIPVPPLEERLQSFVASQVRFLEKPSGTQLELGSGVPLNWQNIINFLYTENIIASPELVVPFYSNDRPHVYGFEFRPAQSETSTDGHLADYRGFGGSRSLEMALSKAVGEMLERYFLSTYKRETFSISSYAELSKTKAVINMREFDFFHDWQKKRFPALDWNEQSVFRWIRGEEFTTGAPVYLPAQLTYWNFRHTSSAFSEKMIFRQTSSGAAGHFTKDEAVLTALLEAIEREGFLVYWLNLLAPKVIDMSAVTDLEIKGFLAYLKRYGLEVTFVDTTSDIGIPTVTCVIVDKAGERAPAITIASSCGFDFKDMILHSAIEAMIISNFIATQEPYVLPADYKPFTDLKLARNQRMSAWQGPEMAERFQFFLSGYTETPEEFMRGKDRLTTPGMQLAHLIDTFKNLGEGHEIYVYEVKNKVLSQLGYHVVRAIVPRLVPLYLEEFSAPLRSRRLKEVPEKIGYRAATEFNRWPHLFP